MDEKKNYMISQAKRKENKGRGMGREEASGWEGHHKVTLATRSDWSKSLLRTPSPSGARRIYHA